MTSRIRLLFGCLATVLANSAVAQTVAQTEAQTVAQTLEQRLKDREASSLVAAARSRGDARRGAVVFHRAELSCARCHTADRDDNRLGPDLTILGKDATDEHLIDSILRPSKAIRAGFEPVVLEKGEEIITGFLVSESADAVVIRDAERNYKQVRFDRKQLDGYEKGTLSLMPSGLVNILASEQQFLDLVRYLIAIRDGGREKATELAPDPSLTVARPLPEYEKEIDHAGMIRALDRRAFRRGQKIYERLCINCHGTPDAPGSLPTSLRFATGEFKNGKDPHAMYETLTRGFGMMAPQTWMVPSQKYDVIHYIREEYLAKHNPGQLFAVDQQYLDGLPKGESRGPAPSDIARWEQMDYGPNQVLTVEIGKDASNFAYKGNAVRLDGGPGGVSQGEYFMVYDYDTLRVAAAWSGKGFIDWNCIHFNGKHAIHPRVVGDVRIVNPTGPGWGRPTDGSFEDTRLVGRDDRIYGPLPRPWAQYRGMYYHGSNTLIEYTVGSARVLEMPGVLVDTPAPVFTRTFNIGPRDRDMILQVASHGDDPAVLETKGRIGLFGAPEREAPVGAAEAVDVAQKSKEDASRLRGGTRLEVRETEGLNAGAGDFTITARIRTEDDGSILAQTARQEEWVADGLSFFIRRGRLTVDIGWVGIVSGRRRVADGKWHDVAMSYREKDGEIRFYVDGEADRRTGNLKRKQTMYDTAVRIGFTSTNFPSETYFRGDLPEVRFYNAVLDAAQIAALSESEAGEAVESAKKHLAARWDLRVSKGGVVEDTAGGGHDATVVVEKKVAAGSGRVAGQTVAGFEGMVDGFEWMADAGNLRLKIPAGEKPLRFSLWFASVGSRADRMPLADAVVLDDPAMDLSTKTRGGPSRWSQVLTTNATLGAGEGPFAVDVFTRPTDNPWFCQTRLTGFDFMDDGDTAIVSAWDGSIWKVTGLSATAKGADQGARTVPIQWRRIASGLFQPLGVKILEGKVFVTCRDQICVLHDRNGDEEIDYFECFNNDHQVTDHFHEFAMGLQSDAEGNLYYAKSARHAKTALVPHHGTLLRVSKDGERTDILAKGFRAANGVCLNPDGSFIVTDQEGHWNPKNRINYVREGGFYGNMYGYHDVTDASDSAMEQPLVWITNSFDRSPAELLWVESEKWGPLNKRLLNLSYGYGKVYIVPHEDVEGQMQGGMCAFPIPDFPTGVMRGRFHPVDGQLYLAGMFAWAGSQTRPGGFYRLRYTGRPVHLPVDLRATKRGMAIEFSGELDAESASTTTNYRVKVWGLKRTKSYGSKHYNEHEIEVASALLGGDGRTVSLELPAISPTWCMEIVYDVKSKAGKRVQGKIHNTIHKLRDR